MEYPIQLYPGLLNPKTKAPFTNYDVEALICHLQKELFSAAETFLIREADLGMPDWMALKDAAGQMAGLCVHDSLILAHAHIEPEAPAVEVA